MDFIDDVELVIFDCDGVVADSEPLATRVLREDLRQRGVELTLDEVVEKFLGRSSETISRVLLAEFGLLFDESAHEAMRLRLFDLFATDLQAIEGVELLLRGLPIPYCLASSSQMERIRRSLQAIRLTSYFDGRIFNAAMVSRGKPAPDLFLHAASVMNVSPQRCVVIEDSPAGIDAGKRAGMRVIGFTGGGHARGASHRKSVAAMQPHYITDSMTEVASLLGLTTGALSA